MKREGYKEWRIMHVNGEIMGGEGWLDVNFLRQMKAAVNVRT